MTRPRLLLVDDHALFRQSLSNLLTYRGAFEVVGEAANGQDAIAQARVLQPDIVLMDIDMPVLDSGIQATRELILLQPDICIVILTVFDDQERLFDAIRAGARGYLVKSVRFTRTAGAVAGAGARGSGDQPTDGGAHSGGVPQSRTAGSDHGAGRRVVLSARCRCWSWWPTACPTRRSPNSC